VVYLTGSVLDERNWVVMHKSSKDRSFSIPEPDYNDPKEVYAFFGLAACCCQHIEQGLVNLIVGLRILDVNSPTWMDVRKLYTEADRKALEQILVQVRKKLSFEPSPIDGIYEALVKRNHLAHHFFVEHVEDAKSANGRREMIDELRKTVIFLKKEEKKVEKIWFTLKRKYDFTEERIEKELQAARVELFSDVPSTEP